jgi:CHAT domain-containing protein/tetratricopeptide (TPR) repeat protein
VPSGRYTLTVRALRPAVADDATRVRAQSIYLDALQGRLQNTAESLRSATEKYARAATLWRSVGETIEEARALNDLGYAYRLLSDYPRAIESYERALTLRHDAGDGPGEAQTLTNLGAIYYLLGENQRALDSYNRALPLRRDEHNPQEEALLLSNIGEVFSLWSEHQKALEYFRQALPVERQVGDQLRESITQSNIGLVYSEMGQYRQALVFLDEALGMARAAGNRRVEAQILGHRGAANRDLGDLPGALTSYGESLALRERAGDRLGQSQALNAIGVVHLRSGDAGKAIDYFTRALSLERAVGSRREEARTLNNLAAVQMVRREFDSARQSATASLSLRRGVQDRRGEAEALATLAGIQRLEGDLPGAYSTGESSLAIFESLRAKVVSQDMQASYGATLQEAYEFVVGVLMQLDERGGSRTYAARALQVSERARARSLIDGLRATRAEIRRGIGRDLLDRERRLQDRLNTQAERQTQLLNGRHTPEQAESAWREIESIITELQELEAEIRSRSPAYAELTDPGSLTLDAIQRLLDDDTVLLEYALGSDRSYLWAVTTHALNSFALPPRTRVEDLARQVHAALTARHAGPVQESPVERRRRIASADADFVRGSTELSRMLLGPVASMLSGKRLLIVADGALQLIPFSVLPEPAAPGRADTAASEGGADPLIVGHEIAMVPSASVLAAVRREQTLRTRAPRTVAIIADPVLSVDDARLRRQKYSAEQDPLEIEALRSSPDAGPPTFRRLQFSREEADAIAGLVAPGNRLRILDFDASRETVLKASLGDYRILHFSTHGVLDNSHAELSGLVLSMYGRSGAPQDGFLRLHEIYNLTLNADLVVLSACETALGPAIRGEGLIGLARGFIYAGASRVVASLWNVEDQATAVLMKRFYADMLSGGRSPAAALRSAQISMLRNPRWSQPYFWAAFVLEGEWR